MKIVLNDVCDVEDFLRMLSPAYFRLVQKASEGMDKLADNIGARHEELVVHVPASYDDPNGLPTDIARPVGVATTNEPGPVTADDELPERDADGAQYDTRWHSEPKKLTDKGVFRARRGRDNDAYKAWLLEQAVEVAEAAIAADETDPVATETHALPQDELPTVSAGVDMLTGREAVVTPQETGSEPSAAPATPATTVDLEALIAASLGAAQDASDSHVDLLNVCRDFTSKHGHPAFTALKAAVAPEDAGAGKAVQHFTPGERRLMQACIANYPTA